jgi:hypothetical protein
LRRQRIATQGAAASSALQFPANPHEQWLCEVIADDQIFQQAVPWASFPGSSGGDAPMATDQFFRARLDHMLDKRHPLAVLARRMPWAHIEASLAPLFAHGPTIAPGAGRGRC